MAKKSGKKSASSFFVRKFGSGRRNELQPLMAPATVGVAGEAPAVSAGAKGAKKKAGSRLWMRFDSTGQSEVTELDKNAIIRRASIPTRDLRILGPIFSHSSNIIGEMLLFFFSTQAKEFDPRWMFFFVVAFFKRHFILFIVRVFHCFFILVAGFQLTAQNLTKVYQFFGFCTVVKFTDSSIKNQISTA